MRDFGFTEEELREVRDLWLSCGLNTKRRVKEMRDLEERIARLEHNLSGLEIVEANCPKCGHFKPIMTIWGFDPSNPTIRCLSCLQALKHIPDSYEIKEE